MNRPYVAAIYIRLSSEDNDVRCSSEKSESNSVSNQRIYIREYMQSRTEFQKAEILEFIDDGYSGTNFSRPDIQKLLELCRQSKIDCILVKDFSRFGRNYLESGDYLEQLFPFLRIRFISINDGYDSNDFIGKTGGMEVAFQNFVYDMYSRDLSEKVKSAIGVRMKKGEFESGWVVYGYKHSEDRKNIVIDEPAATVIRRIFKEVASGKPCSLVAKDLNDDGIPTPLGYKQSVGEQMNREYPSNALWNRQKILRVIQEEKYTGDMVYRKHRSAGVGSRQKILQPKENRIMIPDHHEAIVSKELFEQTNARIKQIKKAKYDRSSRKQNVAVCGYCYHKMALRNTAEPPEADSAAGKTADEQRKLTLELKQLENENMSLYEIYRRKQMSKGQFLEEKQIITDRMEKLQKELDISKKYK